MSLVKLAPLVSMTRLNGQFANLGETWRDQEHQKFAQEFQQTVRVLARFNQIADEQIPFLMKKAQRLQEYFHYTSTSKESIHSPDILEGGLGSGERRS